MSKQTLLAGILALALCCLGFAACGTVEAPEGEGEVRTEGVSKPEEAPALEEAGQAARAAAEDEEETVQNAMGGVSPQDALAYMEATPDLVIVEVNAPEWKLSNGFEGALWIPYTEMAERCGEIPEGRPVILHCGGGIVSVEAYETLLEKRPDIPELSYIAGAPPVSDYNAWLANR